MKYAKELLIVGLCFLMLNSVTYAEKIYRSIGRNGSVTFSDTKMPGDRHVEEVQIKGAANVVKNPEAEKLDEAYQKSQEHRDKKLSALKKDNKKIENQLKLLEANKALYMKKLASYKTKLEQLKHACMNKAILLCRQATPDKDCTLIQEPDCPEATAAAVQVEKLQSKLDGVKDELEATQNALGESRLQKRQLENYE